MGCIYLANLVSRLRKSNKIVYDGFRRGRSLTEIVISKISENSTSKSFYKICGMKTEKDGISVNLEFTIVDNSLVLWKDLFSELKQIVKYEQKSFHKIGIFFSGKFFL